MPMFDQKCKTCGHITVDVLKPLNAPNSYCREFYRVPLNQRIVCGGLLENVWLPNGKAPGVIGDECDVWVKHGICNDDGSPRHYNSKSDMQKEATRRGLSSHVEHKPSSREGDSSPHTSRWV